MNYRFDCKHFNGYKPCQPYRVCWNCDEYQPQGFRILIINLDALGDVLMTTALLPILKDRYPLSTIRWVTAPMAVPLLQNNPLVDEIIPYTYESISYLCQMHFDLILSCDRDRKSTALAMQTPAREKRGFGLSPQGVIIPLNREMAYAYRLGMDDALKFRQNTQTGQQILAEGLGFTYRRTGYIFELSESEKMHVKEYRRSIGLDDSWKGLGINTGCSAKFPNKRLRPDQIVTVIRNILAHPASGRVKILLLGGRDETALNHDIAAQINDPRVIETPTTEGIRRGMHYIAACDGCLTGDTFGAHAAIALKIPSVIFFTISCDVEIDLYNKGEILTADVPCRPCWKPDCSNPYCLDHIDLDALVSAVFRVLSLLES